MGKISLPDSPDTRPPGHRNSQSQRARHNLQPGFGRPAIRGAQDASPDTILTAVTPWHRATTTQTYVPLSFAARGLPVRGAPLALSHSASSAICSPPRSARSRCAKCANFSCRNGILWSDLNQLSAAGATQDSCRRERAGKAGRNEITIVTSNREQLRESLGTSSAGPSATELARKQTHSSLHEHSIQQAPAQRVEPTIPHNNEIAHEIGLSL